MATIVNARDVAIMATSPRTLSVSLPSNIVVPSGNVTGLDSLYDATRQVVLSASSLLFQVPKSGVVSPSSIIMTADLKNITGTATFSVESGSCTFSSSGNTITITPAGLTSTTATIKASVTFNGVTYVDRVTIGKVAEGVDSVVGLLSNEACVISTPFDGTISSYANTGGTFYVFDGINNKTGNAAVTYSVASSTGITASIASTGVYTLSAMTADTASVTFRAVYNGVTIDKLYSISKSKNGANSQLVSLLSDSQVFQIAKNGTVTPAQVTLSAIANNLTGSPTFTVTSGTATLTGTGSSRIMTYSSMSTDAVTVQVTWDGKTDSITIVKVREGIDSVVGFLTNESSMIAADSAGTITGNLSTVGGTFKVFNGITDVTGAATYSVQTTSNMTATIAATGVYTITGLTADQGSVTFRAVYGGVTIDKVYSLAKAKAGSIGVNGQRGTVSISRAITGSSWLDSEATAALSGAGYGTAINRDIVTLYNTSASFSESRFYDTAAPAGWKTLDAYISGNLLVTGSVSSNALSTGAVQAQHLAVSNGGNILANSGPARGTANWTGGNNNSGLPLVGPAYDTQYNPTGASNVFVYVNGTPAAGKVFDLLNNNNGRKYPVKANKRYEMSAYLSIFRATATLYVFWYDASGAYISEGAVGSAISTGQVNTTAIGSFSRATGFVTAPSTAATAVFAIRATCNGGASPYIFCSMAYMGEANQYQTDFSSWSEGGMTTISPGMIETTTLSAITADLGAITAGSISINNKFIVDSSGTATIRSAASGARLEISNDKLIVHDGTRERVRLGNLA